MTLSLHTGVLPDNMISFVCPELSPHIVNITLAINNIISAMQRTPLDRQQLTSTQYTTAWSYHERDKQMHSATSRTAAAAGEYVVSNFVVVSTTCFVDRGHHHYLHSTLPPHSLTNPRGESSSAKFTTKNPIFVRSHSSALQSVRFLFKCLSSNVSFFQTLCVADKWSITSSLGALHLYLALLSPPITTLTLSIKSQIKIQMAPGPTVL